MVSGAHQEKIFIADDLAKIDFGPSIAFVHAASSAEGRMSKMVRSHRDQHNRTAYRREVVKKRMKGPQVNKVVVRVAVVDSDPLRFVGFRSLLSTESDFDLQSVALAEVGSHQDVDIVLLGSHPGRNAIDVLSGLKALRPNLSIIVTGCNLDDSTILKAVIAGAKGCVDEAAPSGELAMAIRTVLSGSVWAPRRVLARFVEQAQKSTRQRVGGGDARPFTVREKEVLKMLVAGCSNKEIAEPLGIEERTVKAHVAKLLRKVGVPNRILLSVHAVTHALVPSMER